MPTPYPSQYPCVGFWHIPVRQTCHVCMSATIKATLSALVLFVSSTLVALDRGSPFIPRALAQLAWPVSNVLALQYDPYKGAVGSCWKSRVHQVVQCARSHICTHITRTPKAPSKAPPRPLPASPGVLWQSLQSLRS